MESKLYEAALTGDSESLTTIINTDPLILERSATREFNGTPLHIAAARDHIKIVQSILSTTPDLAEVSDLRRRTPLHVAAAKSNVEIVKLLIEASPNMCLACDLDGLTPLHVAAIRGRVGAVEELIRVCPEASLIKVGKSGETVFHLCVVFQRFEVLERLLMMKIQEEYCVSARDGKGNTVLHLAVKDKKFQIVKHLVQNCKVDVNATNEYKHTALDILLDQIKHQPILSQTESQEQPSLQTTHDYLLKVGALIGKDIITKGKWLTRKMTSLMVVASLMATMAFQAGVTPPGGVWQTDSDQYKAGEAVVASTYPKSYKFFLRFNTIGFVTSLTTILLLISSLPFQKHPVAMWALVVTMWVTVTSMAFTYAFANVVVTPKKDRLHLSLTIMVAVIVWCGVMVLMFLWHTVRLVLKYRKGKRIGGDEDVSTDTSCAQRIYNCFNGRNRTLVSRSLSNYA